MIPRLQEKYNSEIRPKLQGLDKYPNVNQVPKIEKVIVHMGVSPQLGKDVLEEAIKNLNIITGRKPALNKAKVSVANFKLRQGMNTGCRVTLRRQVMYEFLDRFISVASPRIRDFRGLKNTCFDGNGNYSFGIKECTIFPEINVDKLDKVRGMDITICTSAENDSEALILLKSLNFPIVT